jgi:hypothetical protein
MTTISHIPKVEKTSRRRGVKKLKEEYSKKTQNKRWKKDY